MILPVKFTIIGPQKGFPRKIQACIPQKKSNLLISELGTFIYYRLLRDLFEDLSKFQRISNLTFCKPGLEDLCVTWNVIESMNSTEIEESIIDGLENLNRTHLNMYQDKYSIENSIPFEVDKNFKSTAELLRVFLKITIKRTEDLLLKTQ